MRNYPRSSYDRISRELEREIREKEKERMERERINLREKMVIKEEEEDGEASARDSGRNGADGGSRLC